ncbi:hypothetical protein ARMGADRAFT_1009456 [Armillaria gallica]|uniref:Uncharacterized protein n=1 Tax=Armillaria gallica TaxID=47427 RepID=A0A2H3DTN1_ARMGA|nr:hypothetical protein ARMGADRAFT_1009456 [Armillaria gallica]
MRKTSLSRLPRQRILYVLFETKLSIIIFRKQVFPSYPLVVMRRRRYLAYRDSVYFTFCLLHAFPRETLPARESRITFPTNAGQPYIARVLDLQHKYVSTRKIQRLENGTI